ncbi:MAG TPA: single-stranded-DNA-specific exonuclease RecJ [Rhodobacteraceae bacterium]|nr:single-stranded-DNA-specific exonuclease RecJ [Paracoccaceae bacterium]
MSAFLDVETSLTGRRWTGPSVELARAAEALEQATGLPAPVAAVLARRGVPPEEAPAFLAPTLRDTLPDPQRLKDMGEAAARVLAAMEAKEKVAVFADYDVDGATSAALLIDWFRFFGQDPTLYIPDRIDEGYGPNVPAMEALAETHSLIVVVDAGTLSHEPIAAATAKGSQVVVLDHHLGGETLPPALALVNPNRQDETGDLGYLCAAGVVFLMLVEIGRLLRAQGRKGPDLMSLLDLVALATVADVAPLIGANRALVVQGLKVMAQRGRPGLVALADVARMNTSPSPYHLGFLLGPRINAGGRIGAADLGARLLTATDPAEAQALALRLDQLNTERREIEAEVLAAALKQAEARGFDAPLVWAAGDGWHPGVVGIVAARLKEAANRPAVVIGIDAAGTGKGSGRSVTGIDLGASVQKLAAEGLIQRGGGHRMAAGLTLAGDQLEPAMARLGELLARQGAGTMGPRDLPLDGLLMPGAVTPELIARIEAAGPYGAGAPAPRFAFPDMAISFARPVGQAHLKLAITDGMGGKLEAIAFNAFSGELGPALANHAGARFHFAGQLDLNHWNGRVTPQLRLSDAAPV